MRILSAQYMVAAFLSLLPLPVQALEDGISTGFYLSRNASEYARTTFGSVIFLTHADQVVRNSVGQPQVIEGVRGVYGDRGSIFVEQAPRSLELQTYYWDGKTTYRADGITKIPFGKERLSIRAVSEGSQPAVILGFEGGRGYEEETFTFLGKNPQALDELAAFNHVTGFIPSATAWVGYRGFGGIYPENTLESMENALKSGFQGFEFDVRMTFDGELVVSHDEDLSVTTNCGGQIRQHQAATLRKCRVLYSGLMPESKLFRTSAQVTAALPTLREVFQAYGQDSRASHIIVDLKVFERGDLIRSKLTDLARTYVRGREGVLFILTHDLEMAKALQLSIPEATIGYESESGWEPLDPGCTERYLNPSEFRGVPHPPRGISLNLGLGLGFESGKPLTKVVSLLETLLQLPRGNGTIDQSLYVWHDYRLRDLRKTVNRGRALNKSIVGWTIYGAEKVFTLRDQFPDIDLLISGTSAWEMARGQIFYFNSKWKN